MSFEEDCVFTAFGKKVMAEAAAMAEAERVNMESVPPPTRPTPSDDDEKEGEKEDEKENNEEKNEEKEEKPEGKKGPKKNQSQSEA